MKKQFFRVKQLADQTFSRAGKTDVLSDDLQEADRKVEYLKTSCQNVGKKLSTCLLMGQLQGESGTKEKLLKKSPSYQLGTTMLECGAICDDDSLMKTILNKCGYAEKCLSEEIIEHDHRVEQHVIAPLQNVLETEIPNIQKQKRNVTKVCLDMDSAKARYNQAQKHNSNTSGAAKVESIKDELKDSEQRVEQSRDVLACEMFHLAARESELCHTILQYYKFQKHYHEYALNVLGKLIPELENEICSSRIKPVYGVDLEEHLRVTDRKIAFPIELCVCALLELGMEEEGLFRLAGASSKVKRMKLSFDAGCMTLATALAYRDPHVIAGALKSYLRELPEPLLTHDLYDEWLNAAKGQTHSDYKLQALWTVVHKLPQANFDNLSYLIKFFHVLSKNQEINKMCPNNIAIVIAPSLIWTKDENGSSGFGLNVSLYPSIIDLLVTYADWFFDKEMEFYQTLEPIMNGEFDEKPMDKGIDNKGFDIKVADKMHKSVIEKGSAFNHPGGDGELSDIKRSQSISSLTEDTHSYESPRPITRRKNKSIAPVPPVFKEEKKKEDVRILKDSSQISQIFKTKEIQFVVEKPDKPPRPSITGNSTLPRPTKITKSTESNPEDIMVQSTENLSLGKNSKSENPEKQSSQTVKKDKVIRTVASVSTNTESSYPNKEPYPTYSLDRKTERPFVAPRSVNLGAEVFDKAKSDLEAKPSEYSKIDLISVKKEWLLGKDNVDVGHVSLKKPAVPERPSTLKAQPYKFNRSSIDVNLRNNYENISLSSNESLTNGSTDDRVLQKAQLLSTKTQISVIKIGDEEKRKSGTNVSGEAIMEQKKETVENDSQVDLIENVKDVHHDDDKVVPVEERKTSTFSAIRPQSLPGSAKPERPPKPEYKISSSSSSHTRTFSDGQIIDIRSSDISNNNEKCSTLNDNSSDSHCVKFVISNNVTNDPPPSISTSPTSPVIKHPQTSPPPPPVPAKPRANSQGESTDF